MPRRTTEPKAPVDAFNPPDDSPVILHDDATVQRYREAAEQARQHGPSRVFPDRQPAAAAAEALPMLGVARAQVGTELARLRQDAAGLEVQMQRGPVGMHGQVVPHLAERLRECREALRQVQERITEIESMNDDQIRQLAFELGAR